MTASLRALLAGVIDYAGLFPPAKLPLDAAVRRFVADRESPDAFLLSRFIIAASRLSELGPYHEMLGRSGPTPLSVLGRGGTDAETFVAALDRDIADLELFLERHASAATVDACEVKLPAALLDPPSPTVLIDLFDRAADLVEARCPVPLTLFFEGMYGPDWRRAAGAVVAALAAHRARRGEGTKLRTSCFKLRCGPTDTSPIPPVEQVAFVVAECRDAGVPFKATAGLHHPIRHLDHELLAKAHGFLNLFGGAALAWVRKIDEPTLAEVLADEDPRAFRFDDDAFRWRDLAVTTDELAATRAEFLGSFGSCSFDDPRGDLRALGLL